MEAIVPGKVMMMNTRVIVMTRLLTFDLRFRFVMDALEIMETETFRTLALFLSEMSKAKLITESKLKGTYEYMVECTFCQIKKL